MTDAVKVSGRGYKCANRRCPNKTGGTISLFRFPKDAERAKIWMEACSREDLNFNTSEELYRNYRLCEEHFEKKYVIKVGGNRKQLFNQAVPTIFDHSDQNSNAVGMNGSIESAMSSEKSLTEVPKPDNESLAGYVTDPATAISALKSDRGVGHWGYFAWP